ncbi:MAG: carboxylesterase family protein [Pseudomonadota bacterium]
MPLYLRWSLLVLGLVLLFAAFFMPERPKTQGLDELVSSPKTQRQLASGPVRGAVAPNGALLWLGIPYAASTAGAERWSPPQKPRPWTETREVTRFGSMCPQLASALTGDDTPGRVLGSEDCLFLNVFAPSGSQVSSELPVMVFIHGGGNTIGNAAAYDASRFAQEQGVIIVTLNYRLGILGWFSNRILREQAKSAAGASGNLALLDMIEALHWVRANISQFGGSPKRVTLFGESAGGRNIYGLLASPLAKSLFHGAIVQSGFPGTFTIARSENPASGPEPGHPNSSYELLKAWLRKSPNQAEEELNASISQLSGEELLAYLRGLDLEQLFQPLAGESGMYRLPALFRDGYVLPSEPLPEVFARPGAWNEVPLLLGSNRDEQKLFMALSDRFTRQRFNLFPQPRDVEIYDRVAKHHSDAWKAVGVDLVLNAIAQSGSAIETYAYRFDWDEMRSTWYLDLPQILGAAHALELDFLFEPIFSVKIPGAFNKANRTSREGLGRAMRDYWSGFAYSGDPGAGRSGTQPNWPTWDRSTKLLMKLDNPETPGLRAESVYLPIGDVKAELAAEGYLPPRLKCALYVDLFLDNNGLSELFDAEEYRDLACAPFPSWSLAGESR